MSYESRYDVGRARALSAQDDFDNFTRQENRGKALFMRNCRTCHMKDGNEHFFVPTPANTGLRPNEAAADGGVGDATLRAAELGCFKSPSLRNVEVTGPYGHDGRFATLDALIDHYSDNPIFDPNVGYMMPVGPLKFTLSEKAALIAFLKTLTDQSCLGDPRFSNPFVHKKDVVEGVMRNVQKAGKMLKVTGTRPPRAPVMLRSAVLRPATPPAPPAPRLRSPQAVIDRLKSFDGNADHRISRDELPERMQDLIARGDRNADAALDADEIRSLMTAAERIRPSFQSESPHSQPSAGVWGVIKDLKLPPAKYALALAIVSSSNLVRRVDEANSEIYLQMRDLLDDEEYENFVAAATRLPRTSQRRVGGVVGGVMPLVEIQRMRIVR